MKFAEARATELLYIESSEAATSSDSTIFGFFFTCVSSGLMLNAFA